MIVVRNASTGFSKTDTKPDAGSHRRFTDTNRIRMIPSQKLGIDSPDSETAFAK